MRRPGFTLIELLLAAALVALVTVLIFSALRQVVGARDTAARADEPVRTADLVFEVIRKDFENAVPPTGVLAGSFTGGDYLDDRGRDADTILLFTTAPGPKHVSADGDVRRVEYLVEAPDGPQGEHLLVRKVIHNLLSEQEPAGDEEVVLRGVAGFSLQFYDSSTSTMMTTWDSSQQNNAMPTMVEVGIDLERPDPSQPAGSPPRLYRFTRHVQIPCAVVQQSNVQGLSGGGLGGGGGF